MRMRIETKIRMAIRELGKGTEKGPHNGAAAVMVLKWEKSGVGLGMGFGNGGKCDYELELELE